MQLYHTTPLPLPASLGSEEFLLASTAGRCFNNAVKNCQPPPAEPIPLPRADVWHCEEDVAQYARACMQSCGLAEWAFAWDRAIRRLGCCKMSRRLITLSRHFVAAYIEREPELIRRTILHELAHALAWVNGKERGHGAAWRAWCAALGIPGERASCKCDDFSPSGRRVVQPKYALCHCETGEVYRYYTRQPRMSARKLRLCYIPGKKFETLGKLCLILLPK